MVDIILAVVKVVAIFSMTMGLVPLLIWMERKGAAYIQDRRGPNRAQILGVRLGGVIHSLADALKLLTKEEVTPARAVRPLALLAPVIALFVAIATIAVVPFAEPLTIGKITFTLQVADLRAGLIYVFAMSSLGVYALMLAGWASGSTFPVMGALRSASQMVSYELAMGMAALALFLVAGSFTLPDIVADQGWMPWQWNAIRQPVAFVVFFTAMLAEANRLPFDLPEGESEIVAGYHTEYSSMRFAMFFMGEYAHIVAGSAIVATLFFGGWQIPFADPVWIRENAQRILLVGLPLVGIAMILFGGELFRKKRRVHFGDLRDHELKILGAPLILLGVALVTQYALWSESDLPGWVPAVLVFVLQVAAVFVKTICIAAVFIWIRWTLPRFRYDQLMRLGWKVLLPLGMVNALATAAVVLWTKG